jgi:acyl-coenzyme A thioesterase PaaI-like protein
VSRLSWLRHIGWWPPFVGTGVRVTRVDEDMRAVDVEMRLRPWNRNIMGVHFGGSLYAMTDPFYMAMLMKNLPEYVVWDKAGSIRYRRPGTGTVHARFRLSDDQLAAVRAEVEAEGRHDARLQVEIVAEDGTVVAEVERVVYCATKDWHRSRPRS